MHERLAFQREERVALRFLRNEPTVVSLRDLCGDDELSVSGVDTRSAVALLDGLVGPHGISAAELSASDRDALFAALHRKLWGDRIVSSLRCTACDALYDLSFDLSALQRQLVSTVPSHRITAPNCIEAEDRSVYQLPTAEDEEAAAALGLETGRAQLIQMAAGTNERADAAAALEALAPLLDVDLETTCAECSHAQPARFDVQTFVLQRLLNERDHLLAELHAIACGYGWSLTEILSLARSVRQSLVQRLGGTPAAFA